MKKMLHSIKSRIFSMLLLVSLGSLTLMSAVTLGSLKDIKANDKKIMLEKHELMLEMLVSKQAVIAEEILNNSERFINAISNNSYWEEENKQTIHRIMKYMTRSNPYLYNTFIALQDSASTFYSKNKELGPSTNLDHFNRSWYKRAIHEQKAVWSEVYRGELSKKLMITCSNVLYKQDLSVAGVIGFDLTIGSINDLVINTDEEMGYSFLIDKSNGKLIAGPNFDESNENWDEILATKPDSSILTTTDKKLKKMLDTLSNREQGFIYWERGEESKYVAYATVKGRNWALCLVVPEEHIQEEIENSFDKHFRKIQFYYLLALIAVTIIVIIIGMQLAQKLSRPISALNEGAKKIGSGNLDHVIEVHTHDELENLADEFNNMSSDLQGYITDLETTTKAKEKIESELNIASRIQMDMLPLIFPPFPKKPEIELIASMTPAKQVGGDFYDFFLVNPDKLCFVMADVSGKGIPASLFMVISKTLIKSEAMTGISPAEVLTRVNNILLEENEEMMFVTVLICMLDLNSGELVFANGGHNPPLIAKENSEFDYVPLNKAKVVGVFDNATYSDQTISLKDKETVYLYTDGVTEAMNNESEQFSEDRLLKTMHGFGKKSVKEIEDKVRLDVTKFVEGAPQSDDITTMVLRYNKR